jgi:hypothetical protein
LVLLATAVVVCVALLVFALEYKAVAKSQLNDQYGGLFTTALTKGKEAISKGISSFKFTHSFG